MISAGSTSLDCLGKGATRQGTESVQRGRIRFVNSQKAGGNFVCNFVKIAFLTLPSVADVTWVPSEIEG